MSGGSEARITWQARPLCTIDIYLLLELAPSMLTCFATYQFRSREDGIAMLLFDVILGTSTAAQAG